MAFLKRSITPSFGADYRRLWTASAFTNLGDGVLLSAGPLLVASITSAPAAVGAAVFVQQLPWLLFALVSGALVDRWNRRNLIIIVNVCRALALALLTLTISFDWTNLGMIYGALFILGTGETLADNAVSALVVDTVATDDLAKANGRLFLTFTLGNQLAGPPLGALLFSVGHALPIGTQALTFALAAVLIARTTHTKEPTPDDPSGSLLTQVRTGLTWLWRNRALRALVLSIAIMDIAFSAAFATWVLYATQVLGLNDFQFGLLLTCAALGGLVGPWLYGRIEPRVGRVGIVRLGFVIEGVIHLILALRPDAWVVAITMGVFGIHTMVWGTAALTLRQQVTPRPLLGRVNSVYYSASIGGSALGAAIGAVIAQFYGLTAGFWLAAATMLVVAAIAWKPLSALSVTATP